MKISVLDPAGGPWADLLAERQADREEQWVSRGGKDFVNVSRIVWDYCQALQGEPAEVTAAKHGKPEAVMIETGFLVEEMLAHEFRKVHGWSKPPAIFRDGIGMRPDGYNRSSRTVDEIKVTWMSAHEGLTNPKALRFLLTAKAYCAGYRTTRVRLHVWYVNGDYRPPKPSPPVSYILRFTPQEVEEGWEGIRGHAVDRGWLKQPKAGWEPAAWPHYRRRGMR